MSAFPKGILIPVGGSEDRNSAAMRKSQDYRLDFLTEGVLATILKISGRSKPNIEIIPTASSVPREVGQDYTHAFDTLGHKVGVLNIKDHDDCMRPTYLKRVREADIVLFSGGDQSKITRAFLGTEMLQILQNRYRNEAGFVIAGTSAGAMAMSEVMIEGGNSSFGLNKSFIPIGLGLCLAPELIVDSHFVRRGRYSRLMQALASSPQKIGVGLSDDTGICIREGRYFEVIGSEHVTVMRAAQKLLVNNYSVIKDNDPIAIAPLELLSLTRGMRYDFQKGEMML
ncbi:MAG: cyanophycinase [Cytophagales bacterium]|nr:MAG: cyanophycinase [Cytophagales bacterium]TAF60053.1 MAG: cyanophycinase [Cytophagales bacterium]